jgi:predicted DNA-binding transcriptional regulator YafY
MYHPTSRVLTVLELLQSRPSITGPELASRLEMDVRTVRRYITHLQDVGIPIEANIGRIGGYRLRPGFKLPPLMLNEEEATAVMLGLLASTWLAIGQSPLAIEGALAKIARVLPMRARERLEAMSEHLVLFPQNQQGRPDASLLIDLSAAIHASQRVAIDYSSHSQQSTQRTVEPYGLTGWRGRWYLTGYCCLRKGYRTFRLDRIKHVEVLEETFEKKVDFDFEAFMTSWYTTDRAMLEVEFQVDIDTARQKLGTVYGTLTPTENGTLLQEYYDDIEGMARYLMAVNVPFVVHNPPELKDALRRLGERMIGIANT